MLRHLNRNFLRLYNFFYVLIHTRLLLLLLFLVKISKKILKILNLHLYYIRFYLVWMYHCVRIEFFLDGITMLWKGIFYVQKLLNIFNLLQKYNKQLDYILIKIWLIFRHHPLKSHKHDGKKIHFDFQILSIHFFQKLDLKTSIFLNLKIKFLKNCYYFRLFLILTLHLLITLPLIQNQDRLLL